MRSSSTARVFFGLGSLVLVNACGAPAPADEPSASAKPVTTASTPADPVIETGLWAYQPQGTECGAGDVCGHFLQLISPGSDAAVLAEKAAGLAKGKCGGRVVAYKDKRNVMGAGVVLASEQEKRACEAAFGRPEDTDFPRSLVWRRAP